MAEPGGEHGIILLIEDNEAHAELITRCFRDQKLAKAVFHVIDGQQALDYLFCRGDFTDPVKCPRPDLILLDLRLPRVDGLDVLKAVKQEPRLLRIPVVILTSSDAENDIARSYDLHANSFLVKPMEFRKFKKMLEDLGLYWLGWNAPSPIVE